MLCGLTLASWPDAACPAAPTSPGIHTSKVKLMLRLGRPRGRTPSRSLPRGVPTELFRPRPCRYTGRLVIAAARIWGASKGRVGCFEPDPDELGCEVDPPDAANL